MADYSLEIVAVLDQLGIARAVLAGISMGGYIVMQILRDAIHRIDGLILIGTRERSDSDQAREDRYKTIAEIEGNGKENIVDSMLPKMIFNEDRRDAFRTIMMTASEPGMIAAQRAMAARVDSVATLRGVRVPALIIVGDHDPITSFDDAKRMGSMIRGSKVVLVPNAAHASNFDQPDAFNRAVTDFLGTRFGSK